MAESGIPSRGDTSHKCIIQDINDSADDSVRHEQNKSSLPKSCTRRCNEVASLGRTG